MTGLRPDSPGTDPPFWPLGAPLLSFAIQDGCGARSPFKQQVPFHEGALGWKGYAGRLAASWPLPPTAETGTSSTSGLSLSLAAGPGRCQLLVVLPTGPGLTLKAAFLSLRLVFLPQGTSDHETPPYSPS